MLSAFHLLNEALSTTSSSTKHQVKIAKISNFDDSFVCLSYQNMLIFHVWLSVRGIFLVIFFLMNWSVIIIKWPALFLIIPLLLKTTSSHINMGILISLWLLFTLSFHILAFNAYLFLKLVLIYSILLGLVVLQPLSAVAILLIFNLLVWFHLSLYIYMHITHTHIHMHTHTNIDMIYIYMRSVGHLHIWWLEVETMCHEIWSSPFRLDWLTSQPQDLPVSAPITHYSPSKECH